MGSGWFNTAYSNTKQTLTFSENDVINTALNQFPDVAARNPDGSYGVPEANDFNTSYSNPIFEANMKETVQTTISWITMYSLTSSLSRD